MTSERAEGAEFTFSCSGGESSADSETAFPGGERDLDGSMDI